MSPIEAFIIDEDGVLTQVTDEKNWWLCYIDVRNKIKRNLTFIKISKDENVKTNQEHGTV